MNGSATIRDDIVLRKDTVSNITALNSAASVYTLMNFYANNWQFLQGAMARMVIDTTGNVPASTTSPSYKLDVMGGIASYGSSFFGGAIVATSTLNVTGLTTLVNASTTN